MDIRRAHAEERERDREGKIERMGEKERMRRKIYEGEIERIDKLYRPGTAPSSARPPPSPSLSFSPSPHPHIPSSRSHPSLSYSSRVSLDDSLSEEVRYLSDNLQGFDKYSTNRERRSMSVESYDARNAQAQEHAHQTHAHAQTHSSRTQDHAHASGRTSRGDESTVGERRRDAGEGTIPMEDANLVCTCKIIIIITTTMITIIYRL